MAGLSRACSCCNVHFGRTTAQQARCSDSATGFAPAAAKPLYNAAPGAPIIPCAQGCLDITPKWDDIQIYIITCSAIETIEIS